MLGNRIRHLPPEMDAYGRVHSLARAHTYTDAYVHTERVDPARKLTVQSTNANVTLYETPRLKDLFSSRLVWSLTIQDLIPTGC